MYYTTKRGCVMSFFRSGGGAEKTVLGVRGEEG